jgi:chaperonin GroEL
VWRSSKWARRHRDRNEGKEGPGRGRAPRHSRGRRRGNRGRRLIRRACEEPTRQIAGNAGFEGAIVTEKIRSGKDNYGFNAATGVYEDLVAAGVFDPAKVTCSALQNASSITALMLTTEAMICEIPEKKQAGGGGGEHGGGPGGGHMDY